MKEVVTYTYAIYITMADRDEADFRGRFQDPVESLFLLACRMA